MSTGVTNCEGSHILVASAHSSVGCAEVEENLTMASWSQLPMNSLPTSSDEDRGENIQALLPPHQDQPPVRQVPVNKERSVLQGKGGGPRIEHEKGWCNKITLLGKIDLIVCAFYNRDFGTYQIKK